ncbi:hypothetical protein SHEWT2_03058 [Shewanella hafniensis]|nr:hypothetical protein SHEWT2_03058 [Shewanella hafniensis]
MRGSSFGFCFLVFWFLNHPALKHQKRSPIDSRLRGNDEGIGITKEYENDDGVRITKECKNDEEVRITKERENNKDCGNNKWTREDVERCEALLDSSNSAFTVP